MDYKKVTGWSLIGLAAYMLVQNIGTAWMDLTDWHGAITIFTPAFVSRFLQEIGPAVTAGVGGSLLPQWGPPPAGIVDRRNGTDRAGGPPPAAVVLLVLGLSFGVSGCGATLAQLSVTSESLVHSSIQESEKLHATTPPVLTDQQFKDVNVVLHRVAVAGLTFTNLLDLKTATPADALTFLAVIQQAVTDLKSGFGDTAIAGVLDKLQTLIDKTNAIKTLLTK